MFTRRLVCCLLASTLLPHAPGQSTWTKRAIAPRSSTDATVTYDWRRKVIIDYDGPSNPNEKMMEWDGSTWTLVPISGARPVVRGAGMAYDAIRGNVILYGGITAYVEDDTWEWDGTKWTKLFPLQRPPPLWRFGIASDTARQRIVMFGGYDDFSAARKETWEWDGTTWSHRMTAAQPPPGENHMAFDQARRRVVLVTDSGSRLTQTWEWDGTAWMQRFSALSPPPRRFFALTYDSARQRVVMYGGYTYPRSFNDTWEWDGSEWTQVIPLASPPLTPWFQAAAYDEARREVVAPCLGPNLDETWTYSSVQPASYALYGTGCPGSTGIPTLAAAPFSLPWLGDTLDVNLTNLPPGNATSLLVGVSSSLWGPLSLPFPLDPVGMIGCTLHASGELTVPLGNPSGTAAWSVPILLPSLVGQSFYNQGFVLDPGANPAGIVATNAAQAVVGSR